MLSQRAVERHPVKIAQDDWEFKILVELAYGFGITSYLEIGARHGGSFLDMALSLSRRNRYVAVDLPGGPWGGDSWKSLNRIVNKLRSDGYGDVSLICGDSHDPSIVEAVKLLGPYDLIFIDGDHRYEAVRQDWEIYREMARMIAFHDIVGVGIVQPTSGYPVEVWRLWDEIKGNHRHIEIVSPERHMGIGVIWL